MNRQRFERQAEPIAPALAFEKPKNQRRETYIDTSELALPKAHYLRDAEYRAHIRSMKCLLPKYERPCASIGNRAEVEAAHLQHGGTGVKGSDASCIPLCPFHHDALDAETLPWQIVAFLWMRCWELREAWHARKRSVS